MNKIIKLGFASDHRGFNLKTSLINYFKQEGYSIVDCGTDNELSCDYPDYAYKLGQKILNNETDFGIAICGSGIGISIALNKIRGIYCAKVNTVEEALHTRIDNNTNCVAFSENTTLEDAKKIIETFVNTEFSNLEKHLLRIEKVKQIENGTYHA